MPWRSSQPNQIPGHYKLIFLGACFLGCISTIFLPYGSFHLNNLPYLPVPLKQYCHAIEEKYEQKCGKMRGDQLDEECHNLQADAADCIDAVKRAYKEINFNGCIKYSAKLRACSLEYCQGDETSGDLSFTKVDVDSSKSSGDAAGSDCKTQCKYDADLLKECEKHTLKKWFKKYGVKDV